MEEMSVLWFKTKLAMKLLKYAFADIHIQYYISVATEEGLSTISALSGGESRGNPESQLRF